jgi:alkylation response protein AidB-like acyl-CoA dehydrogenase
MKQLDGVTSDAAFAVLKEEVAAWVGGSAEAWAERIERERRVPLELWDELRERGYLSLAAPVAYGGRGVAFSKYLELMELFSMAHASIRMIVHVVNGTWRAMDRFATEEQRRSFIIPSIKGQLKVAFTLTEPTAGTGADIRSTVVREGDTYYLSGEKHLITFGTICDYWLLFARVAGTRGAEGTVALLVDRRSPGAVVTEMGEPIGVRGTDHGHMIFNRTPVPIANRLGEEGQGLEVALGGFLMPSRISVAMSCVGLARRAHELSMEYARKRETFGKKLMERQAIRFMIAENATEIEAARRLVLHAACEWERGSAQAQILSSMSKLNAVDMLTRVTDRALQIHGGTGYFAPYAIERVYRDARAQRFEEGTNEIQKSVISRELLDSPKEE